MTRDSSGGGAARIVSIAARTASVICAVLLVVLVVFDAQAERFTAGLTPLQFRGKLERELRREYAGLVGVAHNAGDDIAAANRAAAHGVDAIEIDVTSVGGELHASHDAPIPFFETLFFRGPELQEAWDAASLRATVLLHLKDSSAEYLEDVRSFVATRRDRRLIVQTGSERSIRFLRQRVPWAERLLLVFSEDDLADLRRDPALVDALDGVSVRERLLSPSEHAWLEAQGLRTFAWTVNDDLRMDELIDQGIDGVITDRLDFMALLGGRPELVR